jgi:hypothetical protein
MKLVQILLPVRDNHGRKFKRTLYSKASPGAGFALRWADCPCALASTWLMDTGRLAVHASGARPRQTLGSSILPTVRLWGLCFSYSLRAGRPPARWIGKVWPDRVKLLRNLSHPERLGSFSARIGTG